MTLGDLAADATADITRRNALLRSEVRLARAGIGHTPSLSRALRGSVLHCPRSGKGGLQGADATGIHWLFAFTSLPELAAFALTRSPGTAVDHLTVRDDRLVDLLLRRSTSLGSVHGLCVDASGTAPMLLPLTAGIVGTGAAS